MFLHLVLRNGSKHTSELLQHNEKLSMGKDFILDDLRRCTKHVLLGKRSRQLKKNLWSYFSI